MIHESCNLMPMLIRFLYGHILYLKPENIFPVITIPRSKAILWCFHAPYSPVMSPESQHRKMILHCSPQHRMMLRLLKRVLTSFVVEHEPLIQQHLPISSWSECFDYHRVVRIIILSNLTHLTIITETYLMILQSLVIRDGLSLNIEIMNNLIKYKN